jgi:uncharacterized protein (DUF433 family)
MSDRIYQNPTHERGTGILSQQAGHYPSIVTTPTVCGGAARLIRTRIPVWTLERMRQLGCSEIDILRSYPNLRAIDLVQAWSYVAQHRSEIEQAIRDNEEEPTDIVAPTATCIWC